MAKKNKKSNSNLNSGAAGMPASAGSSQQSRRRKGQGGVSAVSVPAALGSVITMAAPQFRASSASDGRICVTHREFVTDISGTLGFYCSPMGVNPGDVDTFPWLSGIAEHYESYLFRSLVFEFHTVKGSSTVGSVMLAVDYDAADSQPADKVELMSNRTAMRCPVWESVRLVCDRQDLNKFGVQRFIRHTSRASLAANLDIKTYDVGTLMIATNGCADTTALGELYVSYVVELMTPARPSAIDSLYVSARLFNGTGPTALNPFGGAGKGKEGDLDVTHDSNTPGVFWINRVGSYLLDVIIEGTGISTAMPSLTTAAPSKPLDQQTKGDGTYGLASAAINILTAPTAVAIAAVATTITGYSLRISPYGYSLS